MHNALAEWGPLPPGKIRVGDGDVVHETAEPQRLWILLTKR